MKEWYGIRTFPGYEHKVAENIKKLIKKDSLENSIDEVFIPTYKNYTFVRKIIKKKEELIYPGYVFVKMNLTNEIMYSVRGVQYVLGYAGTNELKKKPDYITKEEMQQMIKDSDRALTTLKEGDNVLLLDGLNEYEVKIKSVDPYTETMEVIKDGELIKVNFEKINKIK